MPVHERSKWCLNILHRDKRAVIVHHSNERGTWASHNRQILFQEPENTHWQVIGQFPFIRPRDFFMFPRIVTRTLRLDRCNIFPTETGKLIGIRRGTVYAIENGETRALFGIQGNSVLLNSITESNTKHVYFSEYFMNPDRGPVRIWRVTSDLSSYEIAHEFGAGSIRHVHGIYRDPYHLGRLWITVGDFENECYIFYTDDEFRTLNRLGDGTQIWRAVGLLFQEDAIFWLTDTELEQNKIVSLDRNTFTLTLHGDVHGPTWYDTQTTDGLFIAATTVERGPGSQTDQAWLMVSEDAQNWYKVLCFKKDKWPLHPFKFGVISFPSGEYNSENIWISGEALIGLDGSSILCSIKTTD